MNVTVEFVKEDAKEKQKYFLILSVMSWIGNAGIHTLDHRMKWNYGHKSYTH